MPSSSPEEAAMAEGNNNNNTWVEASGGNGSTAVNKVETEAKKDPAGAAQSAYARRLLANFDLLRRQCLSEDARSLCDVELVPGWTHNDNAGAGIGAGAVGPPVLKPFYAHRTVLAASSPYFMAMFTRGLAEASRERVVLQSISDRALESLLGFIYSGRIDITRDNVQVSQVKKCSVESFKTFMTPVYGLSSTVSSTE